MTFNHVQRYIIVLIPIVLLASCQQNNHQLEKVKAESAGEITVQLIDQQRLTELIQNRHGRILLINVWATWCVPCREEFPDLIKLDKQFRQQEVDVVTISADYPDEIDSKIKPFLRDQESEIPAYVQNFRHQEDFINFMNPDWSGALPATFIFNPQGVQEYFLLGKQSHEEFEKALSELL